MNDNDGRRPDDFPRSAGRDVRDLTQQRGPIVTVPASAAEGPSETQGEGGAQRVLRQRGKSRQETRQLIIDAAGVASLDLMLSFIAGSVSVDNYSSQWLYFSGFDMYVPPFTVGVVGSHQSGTAKLKATLTPPGPFTQAAPTAGQLVNITAYEDELVESPGIAITTSVAGLLTQNVRIQDGGGASLDSLAPALGGVNALIVALSPLNSAALSPLSTASGAAVASKVVKATPGKLFRVDFFNGNAAARFLQVFDAAALPGAGSVPLISRPVATLAADHIDFGAYGRQFSVGIVIANSSTGPTLTVGAADSLIDASYA